MHPASKLKDGESQRMQLTRQRQHIVRMPHVNIPWWALKTDRIIPKAALVMWTKQGGPRGTAQKVCPPKESLDIVTAGGDALQASLVQRHASPKVNSSMSCGRLWQLSRRQTSATVPWIMAKVVRDSYMPRGWMQQVLGRAEVSSTAKRPVRMAAGQAPPCLRVPGGA